MTTQLNGAICPLTEVCDTSDRATSARRRTAAYRERKRAGVVLAKPAPLERFARYLQLNEGTGCWEWIGGTARGYGRFYISGRQIYAHRFAYELFIGPLTSGMEIDHLCRVPRCVNPRHLEEVTHRENGLRGTGLAAQRNKQTHCIHGHPFSGRNLVIVRGRRRCKSCNNAASNRSHARRKAA